MYGPPILNQTPYITSPAGKWCDTFPWRKISQITPRYWKSQWDLTSTAHSSQKSFANSPDLRSANGGDSRSRTSRLPMVTSARLLEFAQNPWFKPKLRTWMSLIWSLKYLHHAAPVWKGKLTLFITRNMYMIYIYIDYSQNKFISGLTSAYMGLHYLLIICHYTRVLWVAPHICALLLVLIELLVVLTGSDVQLVLGLGPSCFPSELV